MTKKQSNICRNFQIILAKNTIQINHTKCLREGSVGNLKNGVTRTEREVGQWRIQNPVKHLRWRVFCENNSAKRSILDEVIFQQFVNTVYFSQK